MDEGEHEFSGEGRSRRVIHRGGEGHEDCVTVQREDNPLDLQQCGLVVDRVVKGSLELICLAFLLCLAEGEDFNEVFQGGGVQGGPLVVSCVRQVV